MIKSICLSHVGKRSQNEDNFLFDECWIDELSRNTRLHNQLISLSLKRDRNVNFFAVADGMGGHSAGEVASHICVETLADVEKRAQAQTSLEGVVRLTQLAISSINEEVCAMGRSNLEMKGMGTTLVILITYGSEYAVLNIGDSRAYHFDGHTLTQLTKDHTEGQRMLDLGLLSRKELADFPARKNLSRYIGYDKRGFILQADEYYPVLDEGVVLLCSDGITDSLSDLQIADVLASNRDIEIAGRMLIEQAIVQPNADNATAILVEIGG